MKAEQLYAALALPNACLLGKRLFKKHFLEHGALTPADKRVLSSDVDAITWQYVLKTATIPIQPYDEDGREYLEIAVVELGLLERRNAARLCEIVHRTIPYPVFLVLTEGDGTLVSLAHKRVSFAQRDAIVADTFARTAWMDTEEPTAVERQLLDSLAVEALPHTHFFALYAAWFDRILAYECATVNGDFQVAPEQADTRLARLDRCRALEREIQSHRAELQRAAQFARKAELNSTIKRLEGALAEAKRVL